MKTFSDMFLFDGSDHYIFFEDITITWGQESVNVSPNVPCFNGMRRVHWEYTIIRAMNSVFTRQADRRRSMRI
jgi:hypothetical protein